MARPSAGAIYNVADDEPAPPQDVVAYAATLMGITPPPEVVPACGGIELVSMRMPAASAPWRSSRHRRASSRLMIFLAGSRRAPPLTAQ